MVLKTYLVNSSRGGALPPYPRPADSLGALPPYPRPADALSGV
jgi:hypothetical protein